MSGSPLSPSTPNSGQLSPARSPASYPTRTVAIIKTHALEHRLDIEPRILEASFEIVKERQMEFDMETDPDALYDLFGEDAKSFSEGPVWVYVLERRKAVEVWNTLMGPRDPTEARETAPNSLRAIYGSSLEQNGFMGSPDVQTAEIQIASLFVSSPPFPTSELPLDDLGSPTSLFPSSSMRSTSSSVLSALQKSTSEASSGKATFKARPVPASHHAPSIPPRSSRAALLRAGVIVEKSPSGPRQPLTKEQLAKTFANVPGHKRAGSIAVASIAPPTIAPRMTRAASLRLGKGIEVILKPAKIRPALSDESRKPAAQDAEAKKATTFDGVPGHKRRESISVSSTKAPTVVPRTNRSAALRALKDNAPPSSFMLRSSSDLKTPSLSRSGSRASMTGSRPSLSRPPSQATNSRDNTPRTPASRTPSADSVSRNGVQDDLALLTKSNGSTTNDKPQVPKPLKPRPSSLQIPMVAPRTNKSALLRAAKMATAAAKASPAKTKSARAVPA